MPKLDISKLTEEEIALTLNEALNELGGYKAKTQAAKDQATELTGETNRLKETVRLLELDLAYWEAVAKSKLDAKSFSLLAKLVAIANTYKLTPEEN